MGLLLDTALYWNEHGITAIPIKPKEKIPMFNWRNWIEKIPPISLTKHWFENDNRNIGLLCGGISNLVILDFDEFRGYYDFLSDAKDRNDEWKDIAEHSYRVRTKRGMHVYIYTDEKTESTKYEKYCLDIRSHGNMTLAPPSIHPSGAKYMPINDMNIMTVSSVKSFFTPVLSPELYVLNDVDNVFEPAEPITSKFSLIRLIKAQYDILAFCNIYTEMHSTSGNGRYWMGKCFMHKDSNPSFRVDRLYRRCKCLSTKCVLNKSMDIIDLYSLMYNVDIKKAVHNLSSELGIL